MFGFWSFVPLFLIVLAAVPISYNWGSDAVYAITGDERPSRGGDRGEQPSMAESSVALPLQVFFTRAAAKSGNWRRIDVRLPQASAMTIDVAVDQGTGGEPHKKTTLTYDRVSGQLLGTQTFQNRSTASKVLSYFRWVHTGEAHGLIGQTIAGIVSALAVLMTWTGAALAWRRLIQPQIRRRRLANSS